ncbi:MAG: type VI secretion system protein ImpA [Granulosicoccus sp.]|jgi:type VI secretion system protein ImpA
MENFESSPEFQALVVAATSKPERSMGDSIIPAEPPLWSEVRRQARSLLSTANIQLPLHIYLIQAETSVSGFAGFQSSLQTALQLLQDQWDEVYPQPDLDDPEDMYYERVNLINELSEQPSFLETIYRLPLVSVRGIGDFSTRDLDISSGSIAGSAEDQARCQAGLIRGAFAETESELLQKVADALDALPDICRSLENTFAEKTGQPNVLSTDGLRNRITACRARFHEFADEYLQTSLVAETNSDESGAISPEPRAQVLAEPASTSSLADRRIVALSFNAVLLYYQQYEPSSPVRILTARASDFVEKSFFEVLQALGPECREDLPALLLQLQQQPLAALLSDSFNRYISGESLPILPIETGAVVASASDTQGEAEKVQDGSSTSSGRIMGNSDNAPVIHSRQQVLEVLQDIEAYFKSAEPSSPIPLIVADIRKLVPKHFLEVIQEFSRLLPAAVTESS